MDDPGEARARARRGRLRVEERHGLDQAIRRVEAVYDAALRTGRGLMRILFAGYHGSVHTRRWADFFAATGR